MDSFAPLLRPCLVMPSRAPPAGDTKAAGKLGAEQRAFNVGGRNQPDRRPGAIAGMRRCMRAVSPKAQHG